MNRNSKIAILTGAGVSAESGISTFRDAGGLWEGHDVMEVASPEGWRSNPELVLDFYNQRRAQLRQVQPNRAHEVIRELEVDFEVVVITQNVDDLHERAGSRHIIHLHGELRKSRSTANPAAVYDCDGDIRLGDKCPAGAQLRPHIVWFGEAVPEIERAARELMEASYVVIVGTSMQVYPAAGLVAYAPQDAHIFYVDPQPSLNYELDMRSRLTVIAEPATRGMPRVAELIRERDKEG